MVTFDVLPTTIEMFISSTQDCLSFMDSQKFRDTSLNRLINDFKKKKVTERASVEILYNFFKKSEHIPIKGFMKQMILKNQSRKSLKTVVTLNWKEKKVTITITQNKYQDELGFTRDW